MLDSNEEDDGLFVKPGPAARGGKKAAPAKAIPPVKRTPARAAAAKQSTLNFSQPSQRTQISGKGKGKAAQGAESDEISDDDDDAFAPPPPMSRSTRSKRAPPGQDMHHSLRSVSYALPLLLSPAKSAVFRWRHLSSHQIEIGNPCLLHHGRPDAIASPESNLLPNRTGDLLGSSWTREQLETPSTGKYEQPTGLFINGEFVKGADGKTFETINPTNEKVIVAVHEATEKDVDIAVSAARKAFEGPWSKVTPEQRGKYLVKLAELFEREIETLAAIEALDNGKAVSIAKVDIGMAMGCLRYYGGWADKVEGKVIDTNHESFNYTRQEP
ncbi:MAG: hypothetical protein Q9187_008714, partial [Circinaria calcarea]